MKYYFFLGGHDLEMLEIRKIILNQGYKENISVFDLHLRWGARLSSYSKIIQKIEKNEKLNVAYLTTKFFSNLYGDEKAKNAYSIVGIELINDFSCLNYIEIDHHNENSYKPSSMEQVAGLLNVELNRYQLLVAANDKAYIPAMMEMGATSEEIETIRLADRAAQGVTQEDEMLARKSIATGYKIINGIKVVKSLGNKFSPITDRLFPYEKLLVYNEKELNYYGQGKEKLILEFEPLLLENKAYHGGGENGFFGISPGIFLPVEIEQFVEKTIKLVS